MPWKDKSKARAYLQEWTKRNRALRYSYNKKHYDKLKFLVFEKFGGMCSCCGETEKSFLSIEHVNGGGAEHRRNHGALAIMRQMLESNSVGEYDILCMNCNVARWRNKGMCPHEQELKRIVLGVA